MEEHGGECLLEYVDHGNLLHATLSVVCEDLSGTSKVPVISL